MQRFKNIYLVGSMGAGKSSVGLHLAKMLQLDFFDSDTELEKHTGVTVSHIFDQEGEDGFRARESKMIHALTQKKNIVISTGGGSILSAENRERLRSTGLVVYLRIPFDIQWERVNRRVRKRPLLETAHPQATLKALNAEREPLYTALAHVIVDSGGAASRDVARTIIRKISKAGF